MLLPPARCWRPYCVRQGTLAAGDTDLTAAGGVGRGAMRRKDTTPPVCSSFVGHGGRVPDITSAWGRRVEGKETAGIMRDKCHRRVAEMPPEKRCSYRD
ncbi:hypothetical protein E2C01_056897 [Portunus trituberculatus]|uniref:Uncharacterized protein n=1 Tax=Portunus trituberculatus TaxID=210409 RepID=A0A5B7H0D8_PORTR|nr:hypothetical protein [Portunus trituberculatus]